MKIYLAGGMTVMNMRGREAELANKFDTWKRLFSYHYRALIHKSQILQIKKHFDTNPNTNKYGSCK